MDEFHQTFKDEKSNSVLTFLENASKGNISQLAFWDRYFSGTKIKDIAYDDDDNSNNNTNIE